MMTTRNVFIANLAISDILLCLFTIPLALVDIITAYWNFGQDMVCDQPNRDEMTICSEMLIDSVLVSLFVHVKKYDLNEQRILLHI